MPLSVGAKAPDFTLQAASGDKFSLKKQMHGKSAILYFYPKNFTSACTKEACSFRDNFEAFRRADVDVIGISTDSVESHRKFKKAYDLPFTLLSDSGGEVARLYKVRMPLLGLTRRITYLLNAAHTIVAVHEDLFDGPAHVQEMMEAMRNGG
jgi:peroxiredoxin Q/BCP